MRKEEFSIAISERDHEEAIREVSLKIKLIFPKHINYLIILFTPHYNPSSILKAVNLTLKPKKILGLQSPFLSFEGRIISKGIIACCINKAGIKIQETFLGHGESQEIETLLRSSFKKLKRKNSCLLSFLAPSINPSTYLSAMKLSLGNIFNLLAAGYKNKYSPSSYQIVNNIINEGMVSVAVEGLQISSLKLEGYLPLGKPFIVTKAIPNRNIIMEINGQPAVNIYKHYLERKFEAFIKNRLFTFYPLGIKSNNSTRLINIIDCLEDGSLVCIGEARENSKGNIMFFDPAFLYKDLNAKLEPIIEKKQGLVFLINSLTRKKILKDTAQEELRTTKHILGDRFKMFGIYSDYIFFPDKEQGCINIETGNLLVTLWD